MSEMETDLQAIEVLDDYRAEPTRQDIEWLRAVSDWCRGEASRLERELAA
jgi:hypothetical protein